MIIYLVNHDLNWSPSPRPFKHRRHALKFVRDMNEKHALSKETKETYNAARTGYYLERVEL